MSASDPAVGRLRNSDFTVICTAWIAETGNIVTAAHCLTPPGANFPGILEFNVPPSLMDGTPRESAEWDRYVADVSTIVIDQRHTEAGDDYDWGVFRVFPNSQGLLPREMQGASYGLGPATSILTVTGYGMDGETLNHTQQTASGPNVGVFGAYRLRYEVDTERGNSGSPVINQLGRVVAINTGPGCTATGGANIGTRILPHEGLIQAINTFPVTIEQKMFGGGQVGIVQRWNGSLFLSVGSLPANLLVEVGFPEVLQGDQNIQDNQKYHRWTMGSEDDPDRKNHHCFNITADFPSNVISQFHPVDPTERIDAVLLDDPSLEGIRIKFRDPWYIDSVDAVYGNNPMNRGMQDAVYRNRPSPFNPDFASGDCVWKN